MARLTGEEFGVEIVQALAGPKRKLKVNLVDEGKITCINGTAYTALEIALLKLKRLEDMIDNGELVDVTVFDEFMKNIPRTLEEPEQEEESTIISVCDEEIN